jgi:3-dehydroquinate synthase
MEGLAVDIIKQELGENSYQILVEPGLLSKAGELARTYLPDLRQAFILSNTTVAPLYGAALESSLKKAGLQVRAYQIPDGEDYKNLTTLSKVYDALVEAKLERGGSLWALGGGVVGDLGGFAAATYLRGIKLVQVPTTLLAQVDSSIGGKVAVNHPQGKNLIGAFHQPSLVLADLDTLRTLPAREWRVGFAEIVKYGLLAGGGIWELLTNHSARIAEGAPDLIGRLVTESIKIKTEIVSRDERESGVRMTLNLGHTIGHGLEAATDYKVFRHGEAVAIGLMGAARLAMGLGKFPRSLAGQLEEILLELGLPTEVPKEVQRQGFAGDLFLHLSHDKKVQAGQLRFVLPLKVGEVELGQVDEDLLFRVVAELCGEGRE